MLQLQPRVAERPLRHLQTLELIRACLLRVCSSQDHRGLQEWTRGALRGAKSTQEAGTSCVSGVRGTQGQTSTAALHKM